MSEFKFSCPQCGQKMFGDDQYAGTQINCPACQNEIVVPRMQSVSAGRLQAETVVVVTPKNPSPSRAVPVVPIRAAYMPKDSAGDDKKKMMITIAIICVVVLSPIIFYFAFPDQVVALENKFGFAGKKVDPEEGGGQLGHIADLYSVLDATDPDKMFSDRGSSAKFAKASENDLDEMLDKEALAETEEADEPLGEASWNLNPVLEEIPTGKPHGSISGTNFVADIIRLDNQANQYLLTMRQGTNGVPDCEILVYLQLKPGEQIAEKSWAISASQKNGAPQIIKKWKANPKFAPQQKIYGGGYAMKLEFGEDDEGQIPGKIYLALPDAEKSFVTGWFKVGERRPSFRFDTAEF